jgi:SAM-dependent methyltransferase
MASDYSQTAHYYDLVHASGKDYAAEAVLLAALIRERAPHTRHILDLACGTGRHAEELTKLGFAVDGIDLEPQFIATAAARNPLGTFRVADMVAFELPARYDAILCLFSAIGYVRTVDALHCTLKRIAAHLAPRGTVIIDPWFEPGQLTDRHVDAASHVGDGLAVCRMTRTFLEGAISRLEFDYLIGRPDRVERHSETHRLGLFTEADIESAFRGAGLVVERRRGVLRKRGVYIGQHNAQPPAP